MLTVLTLQFSCIHSMDCLRRRRTQSFLSNTKKATVWEYRNGEARLRTQLTLFGRESNPIMIFTFKDILLMTNDFSATNQIGDFHKSLYKGSMLGGRPVIVWKPYSHRKQELLITSIVVLSNINHKNVVKLIGCCLEPQYPILVYEYFTINGGTLYDRMRCPKNMSWKNRLRIAAEIADALNYMHSGGPVTIIHRDVHPWNVILDESDTAKVIDLGLSVPVPLGETHVEDGIVVGYWGYGEPEYFSKGKVTEKSDVFEFGVILLHLLTCKLARFYSSCKLLEELPTISSKNRKIKILEELVVWFLSKIEEGNLLEVVDDSIREEGSSEQFQAFMEIALRCTREKGEERPAMKEVVLELRRIKGL